MPRRLVILGEEHHHPEHRAFGAHVLPLLRAVDITHLALETGAQAPLDEARQAGRVTPSTDGFSFERQRAAWLPLVAFDMDADDAVWMQTHPDEAFAYRERRMAEHIVGRILEREPAAGALVWVGHGHGQKGTPLKMMAQYLWELAGEEPFSAYQLTNCSNGCCLVVPCSRRPATSVHQVRSLAFNSSSGVGGRPARPCP